MPLDLGFLKAAIDRSLAQAKKSEAQGDRAKAAQAYRKCAALYRQYAAGAANAQEKKQRLAMADAYEKRAQDVLTARAREPAAAEAEASEESFQERVQGFKHRSSVTWDSIGGLEETKLEIKLAYGLSVVGKPAGVRLEGWRAILLYGPPGTGKTMLAAATSNGLQANFFNVPLSQLLSKYFGESSRIIDSLFAAAREGAPSVVYLDEFESLATQRTGDESGAERRVLSTLLTELDGLATKDDPRWLLTIASTNIPWLLDRAMVSRFQKRIYVPLPDVASRESILRILWGKRGLPIEASYGDLAVLTEGYSGRELEQICREVQDAMILEQNPGLGKLVDQGLEALEQYTLKVRPLTETDFRRAVAGVRPRTSPAELRRHAEWEKALE